MPHTHWKATLSILTTPLERDRYESVGIVPHQRGRAHVQQCRLPTLSFPEHGDAHGTARRCGFTMVGGAAVTGAVAQHAVHASKMGSSRPRTRMLLRAIVAVVSAWALAGCGGGPQELAEDDAFYSRNRVELYSGLEPDAPAIAVLDFDTRARILETHRSFVRLRTVDGREGWAPRAMLLDSDVRGRLRALTSRTAALPGHGLYRSRDTLNVHTQPYRWAPTFYQLEKDESVEMLDRTLVDRLPAAAATARTPPEPTGLDYWYLVRIPKLDQTGWLIANMAYADIPLEVAMLAQGRSIVAYFPIGSVADRGSGEAKTTWLWFQSSRGGQVHDFDRMAVLRWDARRSRYVVIRQYSALAGYLPVEVRPNFNSERGTGVGIQVLLDNDGQLRSRNYIYTADRVYQLDEKPVVGSENYGR